MINLIGNKVDIAIWNKKYRFVGNKDKNPDKTYKDTWTRIASGLAINEEKIDYWTSKFFKILKDFKFLPGGRIIANAGTGFNNVTMFNCYVMNTIEDSIEGIFETVKYAALTQKQGGGIGFDFSTIRPKGFIINDCGATASGPISFMQVLNATCKTIMSAGQRRGAQMGVLSCDHPDIEEFILAKRNNNTFDMFNLSVAITNEFIDAVKNDKDWKLKFENKEYKKIKAKKLWDSIMISAYNYAEPGFIMIDNINYYNNLYYCEDIKATNPCGEQPLPPYGACLLGSINLTKFVKDKFTSNASINYRGIIDTIKIAVRMLDNVIDLSDYPLLQQRNESFDKRRLGIGITGLANMFTFMRVKYGSIESAKLADSIMKVITHSAYESSIEIAKEKGSFPKLDIEKYLKGNFIQSLPKKIINNIEKFGIRNSHLISIAPTGTISLLAGNISSGLEPIFSFIYKRKIRNTVESDVSEVEVMDFAYKEYLKFLNVKKIDSKKLPKYFITAANVSPSQHLELQSILQKYVDSAISKTINIPEDYPFEKFKDIYLNACKKGLKGCTVFRTGGHIVGILTEDNVIKEKNKSEERINVMRPIELQGTTYKLNTPLSESAIYITINDIINDGKHSRPYELFINTKNLQHYSLTIAITRLISAVFRNQHDCSFLLEELKSVYDPNGGYFKKGKYIPSLVADIGLIIEKHFEKLGIIDKTKKNKQLKSETTDNNYFIICPKCHEKTLINQENCLYCSSCGYSKC